MISELLSAIKLELSCEVLDLSLEVLVVQTFFVEIRVTSRNLVSICAVTRVVLRVVLATA